MNLPLFALTDDPGPSFAALVQRVGPPMVASEEAIYAPLDEGWIFEVKYNGFRTLAGVEPPAERISHAQSR